MLRGRCTLYFTLDSSQIKHFNLTKTFYRKVVYYGNETTQYHNMPYHAIKELSLLEGMLLSTWCKQTNIFVEMTLHALILPTLYSPTQPLILVVTQHFSPVKTHYLLIPDYPEGFLDSMRDAVSCGKTLNSEIDSASKHPVAFLTFRTFWFLRFFLPRTTEP